MASGEIQFLRVGDYESERPRGFRTARAIRVGKPFMRTWWSLKSTGGHRSCFPEQLAPTGVHRTTEPVTETGECPRSPSPPLVLTHHAVTSSFPRWGRSLCQLPPRVVRPGDKVVASGLQMEIIWANPVSHPWKVFTSISSLSFPTGGNTFTGRRTVRGSRSLDDIMEQSWSCPGAACLTSDPPV